MVVEITPIDVQTLHWKFYIVWTVLNASFVPIVYRSSHCPFLSYISCCPAISDRRPEDFDRLFHVNQAVLVFRDENAISSQRPHVFIEYEQMQVRRDSSLVSANPETLRQRFKKMTMVNQEISDEEKGGFGEREREKV
jgi:hypothetical protein